MRGRYPDYDSLASAQHWDSATRAVVLERVAGPGELRFFSREEADTLRAFADVVLGQDSEPRIPVVAMLDAKLAAGRLEGYRYHDLPEDGETWRRVAANLAGFAQADSERQHEIVEHFSNGQLDWDGLPVKRAWGVVMRDLLAAFYSHPWAWSEIGFGGPAYPRGFARLGSGQRESWESPPEFATDPVHDVPARGLE
jgi:hypothetical protein